MKMKYDTGVDKQKLLLADKRAFDIVEWTALILFVVLIAIYEFMDKNWIVGLVGIICLVYWSFINLVRIAVQLFYTFKR